MNFELILRVRSARCTSPKHNNRGARAALRVATIALLASSSRQSIGACLRRRLDQLRVRTSSTAVLTPTNAALTGFAAAALSLVVPALRLLLEATRARLRAPCKQLLLKLRIEATLDFSVKSARLRSSCSLANAQIATDSWLALFVARSSARRDRVADARAKV